MRSPKVPSTSGRRSVEASSTTMMSSHPVAISVRKHCAVSAAWLNAGTMIVRLGMRSSEFVNEAGFLIADGQPAMTFQVILEPAIVLEPPESRLWDNEVMGAFGAEVFEMGNRLRGSSGVDVCVAPLFVLRKMPRAVIVEME